MAEFDYKKDLIDRIISREDVNGCWNVLAEDDIHYNEWNYYVPTYSSTLWTLVLIADLKSEYKKEHFIKPLQIVSDYLFDEKQGIFTLKKSHFPIPCLNGNMIYLHNYFGLINNDRIDSVLKFFNLYQRFDDGDFITPSGYPYFRNKSCYGKHTCYWGIIKLMKGISFIPENERDETSGELLSKCIDFVLLHNVCYSSKQPDILMQKNIDNLKFPNMYTADLLEILWILSREKTESKKLDRALKLFLDKRKDNGTWEIEKQISKMVISLGKGNGSKLVNERAACVSDYYFSGKSEQRGIQ